MTDLTKLRDELRGMRRCDLLIIAERAAELVSKANLKALLADFIHVDVLTVPGAARAPLIEEVQKFDSESRDGRYFEPFEANARNHMQHSRGTDAFVAEFDRLLRQCVQAVSLQLGGSVREAFEVLFRLLRHIDEAHDDVVYFADEAVVVTNPEVSSVRDSDRIIGILDAKSKKAEAGESVKTHLLITRYSPKRVEAGEMLSLDDIQHLLRIPLIGVVPESETVLQASNDGTPAIHLHNTDVSEAYKDVVSRFLGETKPMRFIEAPKQPLWKRLFGG